MIMKTQRLNISLIAVCLGISLYLLFGNNSFTMAQEKIPQGRILFVLERDGNQEIYVINTDGSNQTNLTNHPANDFEPVWSPDGTRIAFVSLRDETDNDCRSYAKCNREIYIINADGSNPVNLSNHPSSDFNPVWSPDGTRIAFVSLRDEPDIQNCILCNQEIYVMNADGSGLTNLTNHPVADKSPVWSPDSSQLAFSSFRDDGGCRDTPRCNYEIYVMDIDNNDITRLTNTPFIEDWVSDWSLDGQHIAFEGNATGGSSQKAVYIMDADGNNQTDLTNTPWARTFAPRWSPDSKHLVFSIFAMNDEEFVGKCTGLCMTNVSDGSWTSLDNESRASYSWSPDGTHLVTGSQNVIHIINVSSKRQTHLVDYTGGLQSIVWAPNDAIVETSTANNSEFGTTQSPQPAVIPHSGSVLPQSEKGVIFILGAATILALLVAGVKYRLR